MNIPKWIKPFYIVAAFYDGILGAAFLIAPLAIFHAVQIPPPNHIGYVQFPACILVIFAYMLFNIARDPLANRSLIIYAVLIKLSYCLVVFPHWLAGQMPWIWVPFAFFDLIFMIIFFISYKSLRA